MSWMAFVVQASRGGAASHFLTAGRERRFSFSDWEVGKAVLPSLPKEGEERRNGGASQ